MVPVKPWLAVGLSLLASGALGCGRTQPAPTALDGATVGPVPPPIADAAMVPDLSPTSGPDLAPPAGPDLAPAGGADLAPLPGPDLGPDLRGSTCGNGLVEPGEECDDGNTQSGDGCGSTCQCETECFFPRPVVCGDRRVSGKETCDDGNSQGGDGCSSACTVEPGFRCTVPGRRCTPICGDGRVVGAETCDDGNTLSGDGCSEFCLTEDCWDCSSGVCVPKLPFVDGGSCHGLPGAFCGDGILQGAEECDEGADNSDQDHGGCSTHCRYLLCGDGIVTLPEECDLGADSNTAAPYGDPAGCTNACTRPHYCGDGHVDFEYGEECDLGPDNGVSIACSASCKGWHS